MSRRMNDGTGGVSESTLNTLGGISAENRGRRGDDPRSKRFNQDNPYEDGPLTNWGHRHGWDRFFYEKSFRPGRSGGALLRTNDEGHYFGLGPKGWRRLDENIYEDVCETLSRSEFVDASDIEVKVEKGCVYLRGSVDNRQMKRQAELDIESISGIEDVQNQLTIKPGDAYVQEF